MKRPRRILINIIVLGVLFVLFCYVQNLYLRPLSSHKDIERIMHYGPSKVVHTENYSDGKLMLCKYDKWVTCGIIPRKFLFLWGLSGTYIFEYDKTKAISYKSDYSNALGVIYGVVNNPNIKKIDVLLADGKVLSTTTFYDNMFLFSWKFSYESQNSPRMVIGYDSNGKVIPY